MTFLAPYLAFATMTFKRQMAYRLANWAGIFTNVFFLFFKVAIFQSLMDQGEVIRGLDMLGALTYTTIAQALVMVVPQWGYIGVSHMVQDGKIVTELTRPVDFFLSIVFRRLGVSFYFLFVRATPMILVASLAGLLMAPAWSSFIFFFPALFVAIWIAVAIHFIAEISAFWLETAFGPKMFAMSVLGFCGGLILPLHFFPNWALELLKWTPFPYTLDFVAKIYLGQIQSPFMMLGIQIFWAIGLSLLCMGLVKMGHKRLSSLGG